MAGKMPQFSAFDRLNDSGPREFFVATPFFQVVVSTDGVSQIMILPMQAADRIVPRELLR